MTEHENNVRSMLRQLLLGICLKTPEPLIELESKGFETPMFVVQVNSEDQGRCIGKKGSVIWAISTLLWWAGTAQTGRPIGFNLLEPVGGRAIPKPPLPFKLNPNWDRILIRDLTDAILTTTFKEPIPFLLSEQDDVCHVAIKLPRYLALPMSDPNYAEAITAILRVAGYCHGAVIETKIEWQ